MGTSRYDVARVEREMQALREDLEGRSTFPGADPERQRFLAEVREWATVQWTRMAWCQAARKMKEMLPSLAEVCAFSCANLWFCESIHVIRGLVEGIVNWQERAESEQAAREQKEKARRAAAAEKEADRQARAARAVEARASVTVETGTQREAPTVLTAEQSDKMREVVQAMQRNMIELETDLQGIDAGQVQKIQTVMAYQESCRGDDTWIWNAAAWQAANMRLESCRRYWDGMCGSDAPLSNYRLRRECDACLDDMAQYKELCGGGAKQDGRPWYKRMFRFNANMDALKVLAEG